MKRKCINCGFEADDDEYEFGIFREQIVCGNCMEVKLTELKKKILDLYSKPPGYYTSELAERLEVEPRLIVKAIHQLKKEGKFVDGGVEDGRREEEIFKEKIIAYVILKHECIDDKSIFFSAQEIPSDWEGMETSTNPFDFRDAEVIGVIPANDDYKIGAFINDEYTLLGYEFGNSYHPDWNGLLNEKKEKKKKKKNKSIQIPTISISKYVSSKYTHIPPFSSVPFFKYPPKQSKKLEPKGELP